MRSRVAPLAVLALLALPACSSAATSPLPATPSASAPAEIVAGCSANGGWQSIPGARVDAAQRGSGRTVVFANDSGNSPCDWLPLANTLSDSLPDGRVHLQHHRRRQRRPSPTRAA